MIINMILIQLVIALKYLVDMIPTLEEFADMGNGSSFLEMDTKKIYFYDADNNQWI